MLWGEGNMVGLLDIRFEHIGDDTLGSDNASRLTDKAAPFRVAAWRVHPWYWPKLSGSVAGYLCTEGEQKVVGLEINANHVRSARKGRVRGVCKPLHLGSRHQVLALKSSMRRAFVLFVTIDDRYFCGVVTRKV